VLRGHTDEVKIVELSGAGDRLASGGQDGTVRLWGLDGTELAVLPGLDGGVEGLIWFDGGRGLAAVGLDGAVRVWSDGGALRAELRGPAAPVESFAVWPLAVPEGAVEVRRLLGELTARRGEEYAFKPFGD
jgi:hypothetical protein